MSYPGIRSVWASTEVINEAKLARMWFGDNPDWGTVHPREQITTE
jgi:hypothetical protein